MVEKMYWMVPTVKRPSLLQIFRLDMLRKKRVNGKVIRTSAQPFRKKGSEFRHLAASVTRGRCYDFKNIFAKKLAFFAENKAKL
jgi:hypothetical protein